jgi:integrase
MAGWRIQMTIAVVIPVACNAGARDSLRGARRPSLPPQPANGRVLDATRNPKAVQKLLGHESIQTTGDIYTDWDI